MLSYLKRRFSSTDLQDDSPETRSGGGYAGAKPSQPSVGAVGGTQVIRDYQYLPPNEVRGGGRMGEDGYRSNHTAQTTTGRSGGVTFPSAPSSPTRSGSSGLGFVGTITGQLSKTRQLFSTETLNSIISDSKLQPTRGKYKILLVIDHPATDWAKYLYKRRICSDWDIQVEQAQFSDICISAFAEQGCTVTVQDNKGGRPSPKSFKPDFVLIRQGLGATPQHYENILTGLVFGGVPCINSAEAVYNMKNKAWLFGHLLMLRKKLGPAEFPLVTRSFQTKCQPITPDFPLPVTVRIGGDMTRECEVRAENVTLFQSLMNLANTTQRYATTEPCLNTVCDIYIQKIGNFFKAFVRKPMVNSSLSSPGSTILEKIPLTSKCAQFSDICISAFAEQGCTVTVQDNKGGRPSPKSFKPDFVLIRQGLGATPQHYENILTGLVFGGVPCINSAEAVYNMKNKAWLFGHLLMLRKKLGPAEFPLVTRSFQTKCQPITPDFPLPVTVRIGGDMTRECEVRAENVTLFQSLMNLANTTQRYATTEPCLNTVCDIYIQKIGNFFKAFVRKPMVNSSLSSPGSTILEKIPLTSKFAMWINEVASLFGGLDMCSIKVVQDTNGEYFIQDVFGSEFTLLGDGQEEDRMRIAELVLQKMEELIRAPAAKVAEPLTCVTNTPRVSSPASIDSPMQMTHTVTSPASVASAAAKTSPIPPLGTSFDLHDRTLSTAPAGRVEVDPWAVQQPASNSGAVSAPAKSTMTTSFSTTVSQSAFDPFAPLAETATTKPFDSSLGFFSSKPASTSQSSMFGSGVSQNQSAGRDGGLAGDTSKPMHSFGDRPSASSSLVDDFSSLSLQKNTEQAYSTTEKSKTGPWSSAQPSQPAVSRPTVPPRQTSLLSGTSNEDADDTMKNLRKTFAGIFGDI
ncbi:hypothetical protein AAHC03_01657 [Spirometra sp. Aus1]